MGEDSRDTLREREVLLALTGGIACYKSADLASKLVQAGAGVTVVMTAAAERFVTPLTFQALTGRRVYRNLWEAGEDYSSRHISLTDRAEVLVVAPATADVLAKLAAGLADDLVSTLCLSAWGACPLLLAPAMNTRMWEAPATRRNVSTLDGWGVHFVGPAAGRLACRTIGPGRMAEPAEILSAVRSVLEEAGRS